MRKFGPSGSKAHSPLPTPSDAQLGQEVEAHPLWEHLRTFRAMLSEADVRRGSCWRTCSSRVPSPRLPWTVFLSTLFRGKKNTYLYLCLNSLISRTELTKWTVMLLPQIDKAAPKPRLLAIGTDWTCRIGFRELETTGRSVLFNFFSELFFSPCSYRHPQLTEFKFPGAVGGGIPIHRNPVRVSHCQEQHRPWVQAGVSDTAHSFRVLDFTVTFHTPRFL